MLKLENISKYYYSGKNVVLALRKINLEFNIGEFVAITGESGSGKSTLLNVLSNLDTYEEGKLFINDEDISNYNIDELDTFRRDYIGFVFQDYNIIDSYTVYQNVEMALTVQGYSKKDKHKKVLELIDKVGLTKQMKQKAIKLSGGEKQRTVIARTLAKDCPILVCDEPTGNLDKDSGRNILELLHEIGKDKLIIIVTHDFDSVKEFASRKIRLYDGEVVEDTSLVLNTKKDEKIDKHKTYNTRFLDILKISVNNIFAVPKKSLFMALIILTIITVIFFSYGNGIIENNKPYSKTTPYFQNADESRIIVTKYDNSQFTSSELESIKELQYVRTVIDNDMVFDTVLMNAYMDPIIHTKVFYYYKILSYLSLDNHDLIEGVMPSSINEVVIGDNGFYEIGDYILMSNSHLTVESPEFETDQFVYKVVGITKQSMSIDYPLHSIYLTTEALKEVSITSIYENSEIYLKISGTKVYETPTDTWITPDMDSEVSTMIDEFSIINNIRIDNTLDDNEILTFDMMFYNICRKFGYKIEIPDDFDAGLCNGTDFINSHELTVSSITVFENVNSFENITFTSDPISATVANQTIYMNSNTYNDFFGESGYQITTVVKDVFEGKLVVKELEELGFNVFYPSQVIDSDSALSILVNSVKLVLIVGISIVGIFVVGYFVLRNVILSKSKDYLIFRSLGASKKTVSIMILSELLYTTIFSSAILVTFLLIVGESKSQIPPVLRYFGFFDYSVIIVVLLLVIGLMTRNFSQKIYDVSIISSLKGIEQ